ncbi:MULTISPECIES: TrkH family potassium uptake protein [Paenarthrobacter]|uniref:TrkH family potassium uptake protein n=1 Tax=Paenarthrobacter ureafaciens TaxID=37931 RepID=A0AAX3EJ52_PAEUR|nr:MULTISPECIES: potassium transporter TrkG [Paenarthrobacter]NKR13894.1 potassium transporter Trk [Arthrobacter sp. M5]NKR17332.1 potassium transporter Trk [Arthrobacter sp. M6]OEH58646.1 potassium transporter Trk [Arthrobacter sp. D2]OEH61514.1 potassium transporter Trk [Arthrobacter sp. D4]MDO5862981.1 TrkH family potassium uptake protein [Paenarthrobacter sp. SD-2]
MARNQPKPRTANRRPGPPDREGAGILTGLRDLIDNIANSSPARLAFSAFVVVILLFTGLLSLPASSATGEQTPLHQAMFTAVSSVCVTGLTVVSTATHWSFFGQLVILVGIFVGGLGTLTLASLLALMVSKRLGVRGKLIAQEAMNNAGRFGEVGTLLRIVIVTSVVIEAGLAIALIPRFVVLGEPFWQAVWHGVFYSISAFNNAGFTPHSDGIVPYETDLWILVPLMLGVFLGSLGFPVVMVLRQNGLNWKKWNLHTKLTIQVSLILLAAGTVLWAVMEWDNVRTIGTLEAGEKVIHSLFASVMTRSGGFNLVDQNQMESTTMLLTDALMFAGGGSASTAGGIKVTTIAVMFLAIVAEARGDADVKVYGRTIPQGTMRVAISVIVAGATIVSVAAFLLLQISGASLDRVLFETISAFATVGLSTNLSAELPPIGVYVLSALMFAGRVGTVTLAAALALRQRSQLYHYPEERPIIG